MAENSAIEWCDHTFNPWIGCTKVGPGCDHCYAEELSRKRFRVPWGLGAERRRTKPATWSAPRRWDRAATAFLTTHGRRQRVFCASLAGVFDNEVDPVWRADLFALIRETPNLDWLIVTKRIGNAAAMAAAAGGWPPNVWLGATIVNQAEADRDVPKLTSTPGPKVGFLSVEPMLGPIDLSRWTTDPARYLAYCDAVGGPEPKVAMHDWVIVGGESGDGAHPMHPDWARRLRDQCAAAGVPFLFKQWGEWAPGGDWIPNAIGSDEFAAGRATILSNGVAHGRGYFQEHARGAAHVTRVGKKAAGRLLDGVQHDGVPA